MNKLLWQPTPQAIANSNMSNFMTYVNCNYKTNFRTYPELYQWSIDFPERFWVSLWTFCDVKYNKFCDTILQNPEKMPGAKWFVGAQLNFAENLLRHQNNNSALVFCNEAGVRQTLTYQELYKKVAQLASALRKAGVTTNDRVAGWMPNCIETVVAMLATTSIGAIWSSCSPDFGTHGVLDRFGQITPKVLFTIDGYKYGGKNYELLPKVAEVSQQLASLEHIIIVPYQQKKPDISTVKHAHLYEDFVDHSADKIIFESLPFDHPIYIMYSSGTTGVPKCIVHGAGNTLLQHLKELVLHTNLTEQDTLFYYTTCGWMMWNWFISSLAVGATLILYDGSPFHPTPAAMFDLIDQEKINVFGTSAKYIAALEKHNLKPIKTHQLTSLRTILSTGSPLLPENFDYVYQNIKKELCLSSISGGTDIISCFALGNPMLPVYRGELQCRGLGLKVAIFNEHGRPIQNQKGELVCTAPFPSMPIYFWGDTDGSKYHKAYFAKYPNVWSHGDYAELTDHDGIIIYGRSDTVLNPGGVRIGTAEIYRQVEKIDEVLESIAIGQDWKNDVRVILFVRLRDGVSLNDTIKDRIKKTVRDNASPHHVPAKIIQVADIPKTINGKLVELAVREVVHGQTVKNLDAIGNPEALEYFKNLAELNS